MYQGGVESVMYYPVGIWGNIKTKSFDIVHNKAMRLFLDIYKYTPNAAVHGDMGWLKSKFT